jgi:hypothetical protein
MSRAKANVITITTTTARTQKHTILTGLVTLSFIPGFRTPLELRSYDNYLSFRIVMNRARASFKSFFIRRRSACTKAMMRYTAERLALSPLRARALLFLRLTRSEIRATLTTIARGKTDAAQRQGTGWRASPFNTSASRLWRYRPLTALETVQRERHATSAGFPIFYLYYQTPFCRLRQYGRHPFSCAAFCRLVTILGLWRNSLYCNGL